LDPYRGKGQLSTRSRRPNPIDSRAAGGTVGLPQRRTLWKGVSMELVARRRLAPGLMVGVVTALVLAASAPAAGTGAKLSLKAKPRNPAAGSVYKLKVK